MNIPKKYKFIIELGKALHVCGVQSYKSQHYLTEIAEIKEIKGSFMDTPTWINYTFYGEDENTYNYVECVPPGELNLGALSKVVEITNRVINNTFSFEEAYQELKKMNYHDFSYGKIAELLAFMLSAGAFSIIVNPNWISALAATFAGGVIFFITLLAPKSSYVRSTLESLVAFISTLIIGVLSTYFPQINISLTVLSSIIIFIPGLSITTALEEITSRNLVSGTAKLADALISLFKQFFGVILGLAILPFIITVNPHEIVYNIPTVFNYVAIGTLSFSLVVLFKIRLKDIPFSVITGFVSFYTTIFLQSLGILLSIFVGTIFTAIASKVFSQLTKTPRLVYLIPGIIMLVPGSKAFIGLSSLFIKQDLAADYNMGEQVLFIFMGIIGGLIFSGSFMNANAKKRKKTLF